MKTILIASTLYLFSSFLIPARTVTAKSTEDKVYFCDSKGGKKYHFKESCSGLQRCTHVIRATTLKNAKARGLTACLLED